MKKESKTFYKPEEFIPSLRQLYDLNPLDLNNMIEAAVAVEIQKSGQAMPIPAPADRHDIVLTDGRTQLFWRPDSLRSLFRGDKKPPPIGDFPEVYEESFLILDWHVLEISRFFGDRRDLEMLEIYSNLRRRPDGRSLGFVHDHMWRAAAFMLGARPLSQAEFEAILARLERSCRTFERGPTSRNYVATLRTTIGSQR